MFTAILEGIKDTSTKVKVTPFESEQEVSTAAGSTTIALAKAAKRGIGRLLGEQDDRMWRCCAWDPLLWSH